MPGSTPVAKKAAAPAAGRGPLAAAARGRAAAAGAAAQGARAGTAVGDAPTLRMRGVKAGPGSRRWKLQRSRSAGGPPRGTVRPPRSPADSLSSSDERSGRWEVPPPGAVLLRPELPVRRLLPVRCVPLPSPVRPFIASTVDAINPPPPPPPPPPFLAMSSPAPPGRAASVRMRLRSIAQLERVRVRVETKGARADPPPRSGARGLTRRAGRPLPAGPKN